VALNLERLKIEEKEDRELAARLTAPQHIVYNRFEEHAAVEGYEQDRDVADYYGCDRLMKLDTIYGRIQLAYDPRKGQSFIFANIKTSVYDNAASAYQRGLKETMMMKQLKTGNQNIAFSSRRMQNSSVLLFKMENKPWTEGSVKPYLNRLDLQALQKTMPFLQKEVEVEQRGRDMERRRRLQDTIRDVQASGDAAKLRELRAVDTSTLHTMEHLDALIYRKAAQSQNFFHKVNMAFDLQKAKMFEYYRNERERRRLESMNEQLPGGAENNEGDEDEDE